MPSKIKESHGDGQPYMAIDDENGFMPGQFGGSISFDWSKEGLVITLQTKKARLFA